MDRSEQIKQQILKLTKEYYEEKFAQPEAFSPGDRVNYAGRVFNDRELTNLVDSSLEFWLTAGQYTAAFEKKLAETVGVRHCAAVNSGSSANLLAFMALTDESLGERRIKKGDEVITVAAGFPTTIAPILQFGAVPVFLDITLPQYNIDISLLAAAKTEKTKAVMLAHTLGNPFDLAMVKAFCDRYDLWLVEDNCDSLGSEYYIDGAWKKTGSIGHIGTSSFYPPHHITMGEGGAVYTDDPQLFRIVRSLRDWGRDCWCDSGEDNSCGRRFSQQFGILPFGYDHKYVYSRFGYNLKATDMQAAVGVAQLDKLDDFTEKRRKNWVVLRELLESADDRFILPEPAKNANPSWFGFMLTLRETAPFSRNDLVAHLEKNNIQTRNLFAGNILRHPCFDGMRKTGEGYRVVGVLANTDAVTERSFWVGVYPGMTDEKLGFMAKTILDYEK